MAIEHQDRSDGKLSGAIGIVKDKAAHAGEATSALVGTAAERAGETYSLAREKASSAYSAAREQIAAARHSAGEELAANPLAVLLGGLAVGIVAGALLPRSDREAQLLAPIGSRATDLAREAFAAAREAGTAKLAEAGLTRDAAREKANALLSAATDAAKAASSAAAGKVRETDAA